MKAWLSGGLVLIVEHRGCVGDIIKWTGKRGEKLAQPVVKHATELGGRQLVVTEDLPEGADVLAVKSPFAKGSKCVLVFKSFDMGFGAAQARGSLEPLESAGASRV